MKTLFLPSLLIFSIIMTNNFIQPTMSQDSSNECDNKCEGRCAAAGLKDRCLKYCGICCSVCKCVPAGTYGNKHQCPCYRDMRNSKGKPKCP